MKTADSIDSVDQAGDVGKVEPVVSRDNEVVVDIPLERRFERELTTSKPHSNNDSAALTESILLCGPVVLARYVLEQARVCCQSESDLVASLRRYRDDLQASGHRETSAFSVGDLWTGLLWWRDEISWVGRAGVFSRSEIIEIAVGVLTKYLAMLDRGMQSKEIASELPKMDTASNRAHELLKEINANGGTPNFRALVWCAVCRS
jgi:hypothetical protein